jgi:hypothetical protein
MKTSVHLYIARPAQTPQSPWIDIPHRTAVSGALRVVSDSTEESHTMGYSPHLSNRDHGELSKNRHYWDWFIWYCLPIFARLCCLRIQVARPPRRVNVIYVLLDLALESVPCADQCLSYALIRTNRCEFAATRLQFLHLKFKICSVDFLFAWLVWRSNSILSKCNAGKEFWDLSE